MNFTKSDFFDPRPVTNQVNVVDVGDEYDDEYDFPGGAPDENDSESDEGDDDHNTTVDSNENEGDMAIDDTQTDPGENLASKPDGKPHGFMKKEGCEDLTVEDQPGINKIYKMQLYTDDMGGNDVYTCLGKVKEEEYYVLFKDLKLRVDVAYKKLQLSLYKIDHNVGSDVDLPPMKYWNQFYTEIQTSPFLTGQAPVDSPSVGFRPLSEEEKVLEEKNAMTEERDASYANWEDNHALATTLTNEQRKKMKIEEQSTAQQEVQMPEERPLTHQSEAMLGGGQPGGSSIRRTNRYSEATKSSEERTARHKHEMGEDKCAFGSIPHLTPTERKDFLSQHLQKRAQNLEEERKKKAIARQTDRFVQDQLLMYQTRLKNSGRASRWSAKARYRTHLPREYTVGAPLDMYMTIRGDLVKFFNVDTEVISTSEDKEMQKWLDAFLVRTMQLKFKLHYAKFLPGTNHEFVKVTSLNVGNDTVSKLKYYSCHPAQFYQLYVNEGALQKLLGTPVKRGDNTSYERSWDLHLNCKAMVKFLKEKLDPIVTECLEVDKLQNSTLGWEWRGNGDTHSCLNFIKYGMAMESKRGKQQKAVMGCSATEVAKLVWGKAVGQRGRRWAKTAEWLHRSGFRMGGLGPTGEEEPTQTSQTVGNLVFGTKEANTAMLRYEDAAARMVEYWEKARYEALYPPEEWVHTFAKMRILKKRDENNIGNKEYEVEWKMISLKRFTFKQWLERSVKAGNAVQNHITDGSNVRPEIDERLIAYRRRCQLEDSQNPFLTEEDRLERQRQLEEAMRNRVEYNGPNRVHPLDTYETEHGHLTTSILTAANIPIILDLYDAIMEAENPKRDLTTVTDPEGVPPAVSDKVLDELRPEFRGRWKALPLSEQHRAAALTGWIAKTLTWDFSINFPSMYNCKTDTYDDRIRNIQWNKPIQMSTEFNLNSRYTPFLMEAQLDEQFDTTLWEREFFKASGPKWGKEVPIPNLGLDEEVTEDPKLELHRVGVLETEEELRKAGTPTSSSAMEFE